MYLRQGRGVNHLETGISCGGFIYRDRTKGWGHLETGISRGRPSGRHGLEHEAVVHHLKLRAHHHFPLEGVGGCGVVAHTSDRSE